MCLEVLPVRTKALKRELAPGAIITCWKVLKRQYNGMGTSLVSPYWGMEWKPGTNMAIDAHYPNGLPEIVEEGLHVYTRRLDADRQADGYPRVVVEVTGRVEDLIAVGIHDSNETFEYAFYRLYLSQAEYNLACGC